MGRFHRVRIVQADSVAFLKNPSRDNGPPSRHSLFCRQMMLGVIVGLVILAAAALQALNRPQCWRRVYYRTFALRRSLCSSNRRRFDSSSQSIL